MRPVPLVASLATALALACASPDLPAPAEAPRGPHGRGLAAVLEYEGTIAIEGHFRVPGEVRTQPTSWRIRTDGQAKHRLDVSMWEGTARSDAVVETIWMAPDALIARSGDEQPRSLTGAEATDARVSIEWSLPWTVADGARIPDGETTLTFDGDDRTLLVVARAFAHPRLGDVTDEARYGPTIVRDGLPVPSTVRLVRHGLDATWRIELRLVAARREQDGAALSPPAVPPAPPAAADAIRVTRLADHVWALAIDDADTRSFVVEFADHVAVLDAPLTSRVGERIVDSVATHFPGKPIRYAFFSHYHPHYTGGLRALIAAGATIVGGRDGTRWVEQLARRPFTRAPDRLARSGKPASSKAFTDCFVVEDAVNRLEAIDIGAESEHTDEYVVFYLPRARLLIQGDLGWFPGPSGALRAGRRARALVAAIDKRGLAVDTLAQSWPVRDEPATLSLAELRALAAP